MFLYGHLCMWLCLELQMALFDHVHKMAFGCVMRLSN